MKRKEREMNKIFIVCAGIFMLFALCGCNHKDLYYMEEENVKVRLAYDWRDAPEASPAGMCAFFYSIDDAGRYSRFDFPNTTGGVIELPAGKYMIITYNNDTEAVQFASTSSFSNHNAYTRTGSVLEPLYGYGVVSSTDDNSDEPVVIVPDNLWGCTVSFVEVAMTGAYRKYYPYDGSRAVETTTADSVQVITCYPHDMLCHYSYEVRNVKNIDHLSKVSGSLSGMSGKMNVSTEMPDDNPVTLAVGGKVDKATGRITGEFLTFGHSDTNKASHKMEFYVVMDNGSKYRIRNRNNLDVTTQVDTAANRRHVHIVIDGLDLPDDANGEAGFDPTVDSWEVIHENLEI